MTDTERQIVALIADRPGITCTEIGETLWGRECRSRQSYARPAGRILARLRKDGLVKEAFINGRRVFFVGWNTKGEING